MPAGWGAPAQVNKDELSLGQHERERAHPGICRNSHKRPRSLGGSTACPVPRAGLGAGCSPAIWPRSAGRVRCRRERPVAGGDSHLGREMKEPLGPEMKEAAGPRRGAGREVSAAPGHGFLLICAAQRGGSIQGRAFPGPRARPPPAGMLERQRDPRSIHQDVAVGRGLWRGVTEEKGCRGLNVHEGSSAAPSPARSCVGSWSCPCAQHQEPSLSGGTAVTQPWVNSPSVCAW